MPLPALACRKNPKCQFWTQKDRRRIYQLGNSQKRDRCLGIVVGEFVKPAYVPIQKTLAEWARFKERSPQARMVCIDVQANATTQAKEREDILNIGGFSDVVFSLIAEVAEGRLSDGHWVSVIEAVTL